jgi:hypothetical protein
MACVRRAVLVLAAIAALAATAPAAHAGERTVPPRFFGVMWDKEIQDAPLVLQDREWARMAANGVESARVVFAWDRAQPDRGGPISFAHTDPMVANGARHGIDVLPVAIYAPPWARVQPGEVGSAPSDRSAYTAYLVAAIERYGPGGAFWRERPELRYRPVRIWQIWNEPHLPSHWLPQSTWPERYGQLLRSSYRAVKRADPGARVVLTGLANASWRELNRLYLRGRVEGYFDVAAIHHYSRTPGDFLELTRRMRQTLDKYGDRDVSIWWTETGASASAGRLRAPGSEHFQTTDRGLAKRVAESYRLLARARRRFRIERVYWYTWASSYQPAPSVFDYSGMSVFDGSATSPKPALSAYRRIARSYRRGR